MRQILTLALVAGLFVTANATYLTEMDLTEENDWSDESNQRYLDHTPDSS